MFPRRKTDPQAGFSLPEVLVTIVIVSLAFSAILGGMIATITVSDFHRKQARTDSVARDAAEWVKDSVKTPYQPCAAPGDYTLAGMPKNGFSVSVERVEYWDGAAPSGAAYAPAFGPCPSPDRGLQRITIMASSPDGRATERVQILKRIVP